MAPRKLYVGRKIREIREQHRTTQSGFAERLGISTSYLNQIENNQRPVSAAVLLALAENYQIDIGAISLGDDDRLLSAVSEALADPVFDNYKPNLQELKLITQNAPGLAHALIACHQAYRRNSEQLASLDNQLGRAPSVAEPAPYEEVRDFFHFIDNYVHEIDIAAEKLAAKLDIPGRDIGVALSQYMENHHRVRVARADPDEAILRRFNPETRILHLNPYSPASTRNFQIAFQIAELEMEEIVTAIAKRADFRSAEAVEICKIGLRNYFAGALMLPYQIFLSTAKELRHDLELLASRFGASLEQVAHRLSTLQRSGQRGVPVFLRVSTEREISPSVTVLPSCNLRVMVQPVRSGMCIRRLKRRGALFVSSPKRLMVHVISVLLRSLQRVKAVLMPRSAAMP